MLGFWGLGWFGVSGLGWKKKSSELRVFGLGLGFDVNPKPGGDQRFREVQGLKFKNPKPYTGYIEILYHASPAQPCSKAEATPSRPHAPSPDSSPAGQPRSQPSPTLNPKSIAKTETFGQNSGPTDRLRLWGLRLGCARF